MDNYTREIGRQGMRSKSMAYGHKVPPVKEKQNVQDDPVEDVGRA